LISKILANRLSLIAPKIISDHQKGFIRDRHISECICITSEAINLLDKKSFGGNLALKIDIRKAFDTLDWDFLLLVLKSFGFNQVFCNWIKNILNSAKLSLIINGKVTGFFNVTRGVRQGDPLSPLLFCIAEEVLSRSISLLVDNGKLDCITGPRGMSLPSHAFFADDIMIFCKGSKKNALAVASLFLEYAANSGQIISPSKCMIFSGSISTARLAVISRILNFSHGTFPFNYLGVPIFKGRPKSVHLQSIADKIKIKLASWKGHQLVNFVIHGMLIYSFKIYSWPVRLLKQIDKWIKKFVWSGSIDSKKLVSLSWQKLCTPLSDGGLGMRSISKINEAGCMKLCCDLMHTKSHWFAILRNRFFSNNKPALLILFLPFGQALKKLFWLLINLAYGRLVTVNKYPFGRISGFLLA
jgi:hypothetical protein